MHVIINVNLDFDANASFCFNYDNLRYFAFQLIIKTYQSYSKFIIF